MTIVVKPTSPIQIAPSEVMKVQPSQVIRIAPVEAVRVVPVQPVTIRPPRRGAWDERGWGRSTKGLREIYEGFYQVGRRQFRGRIEKERSGKIAAYIHNPPTEIRGHRHHACFQQVGVASGWFHLHWNRAPRDVDGAILYMEKILDESLKGR